MILVYDGPTRREYANASAMSGRPEQSTARSHRRARETAPISATLREKVLLLLTNTDDQVTGLYGGHSTTSETLETLHNSHDPLEVVFDLADSDAIQERIKRPTSRTKETNHYC